MSTSTQDDTSTSQQQEVGDGTQLGRASSKQALLQSAR